MFSRRLQISLTLGSVAGLFAAMVSINARLSWRPVSVDFASPILPTSSYVPLTWRGDKLWILDIHGAPWIMGKNHQWKEARNWNRGPLSITCVSFGSHLSGSQLTAIHPNNNLAAVSDNDFKEGMVIFLPLASNTHRVPAVKERGHSNRLNVMSPGEINLLSFSPDGKRLITNSHLNGLSDSNEVKAGFCSLGLILFDAESKTAIARQSAFEGSFSDVAWSPDSRTLAGITVDGFVFVLDAQTGKLKFNFRAHGMFGACIAWSPDGKTLVTATNPRVAMSPTRIEYALKSGTGFMGTGTVIGEGKNKLVLATDQVGDSTWNGKTERQLKRFDAQTGKQIGSAIPLQTGAVDLAFSPDGTQIALGEHEFALLLNAQTLVAERRLDIPKPATSPSVPAPVCLAWSNDGATLATSTAHGLTLWRVR